MSGRYITPSLPIPWRCILYVHSSRVWDYSYYCILMWMTAPKKIWYCYYDYCYYYYVVV